MQPMDNYQPLSVTACVQESQNLRISTFNCKNIVTNSISAQELLNSVDILCIQEHWLFNFQLENLNSFNPKFCVASKAVDDSEPILPIHKPKGYGGTAIFWRESINHAVTPLADGDCQIQCIEVRCQNAPFLVASVYMPARKDTQAEQKFAEMLDQLHEIYQKYSVSHHILLAGDFNCDLSTEIKLKRQHLMHDFLREQPP